jgi:sugar/nucleoside kinase (ribokinase family)
MVQLSKNAKKDLDCTVIGDVFIDATVVANSNQVHFSHGGTSYCELAKVDFGGSGNVAAGLASLEGKVAFVGKGGDDFFRKAYHQNLRALGIITKIFIDRNLPTGLLIALVDESIERSFLVFRGANDTLSKTEVERIANLLKRSKYVHISGHSLLHDPQKEAILRAVELSKTFGSKIVFDPGAHNIIKSKRQFFNDALGFCDVLSVNLEEAKAITNESNLDYIIDQLAKKVPLTALKCGPKGCILLSQEKILEVPGFKVKCLDPTGAGDAFTAALVYGLTHDISHESTCTLANWFASRVVTKFGARAFPAKSEIKSFLKELLDRSTGNV